MPLTQVRAPQAGLTTSLARIAHSLGRAGAVRCRNAALATARHAAHEGRDMNRGPGSSFGMTCFEPLAYPYINIFDVNVDINVI